MPPGTPPPGVFPSADGAEVTSPVSIMEWLMNYLQEARARSPPPLEGVCRAGELLFVPRGWWHLVVNVEEGVAITHNYVGREDLPHVLQFLRDRPEQVSGYRGARPLYDVFRERLRAAQPALLDEAERRLERLDRDGAVDEQEEAKPTLWKRLKLDTEAFSFGFGFGADDADADDESRTEEDDDEDGLRRKSSGCSAM